MVEVTVVGVVFAVILVVFIACLLMLYALAVSVIPIKLRLIVGLIGLVLYVSAFLTLLQLFGG